MRDRQPLPLPLPHSMLDAGGTGGSDDRDGVPIKHLAPAEQSRAEQSRAEQSRKLVHAPLGAKLYDSTRLAGL